MPIEMRDVLKVNVILVGFKLLNDPAEVDEFSKAVSAEVEIALGGLDVGLPPIPLEPARRLQIPRERVILSIASSRTVIEREYPGENDLDRLANIADHAIRCTADQPESLAALGYNIELVFRQTAEETAFQYLKSRLFHKQNLGIDGWTLIGGSGRLVFDSAEGRWTARIEPRHNDDSTGRVFVSLNLHKVDQRVPLPNEIRQNLNDVWGGVDKLISRLDEGVLT